MVDLFYEIYDALPRGGPGNNESTKKAFKMIPDLPDDPKIIDMGCGKGVQTIELMKISNGYMVAVDNHRPFLRALYMNALPEGISERLSCVQGDMFSLGLKLNTFDLIWSEGAIYILGFENGLKSCRSFLRSNGCIAVTEITWLKENPPVELADFFNHEYPDMQNIQANLQIIDTAGYDLIDYFVLPEEAWWDDYYFPLEQRVREVEPNYRDNTDALELFDLLHLEIEMYRNYSEYYGYVFYICKQV